MPDEAPAPAATEDALLQPSEAARFLNVTLYQLKNCHAAGLPYIRFNARVIRYRRADVEQFLAAHRQEPLQL